MTDQSYVSLEQRVCIVCMTIYETGAVFFDQRLRPTLEHDHIAGWGLCSVHRRLHEEGFIALVEIDEEKSRLQLTGPRPTPECGYRTGRIAYLKRDVFHRFFKAHFVDEEVPCVFVAVRGFDQAKL